MGSVPVGNLGVFWGSSSFGFGAGPTVSSAPLTSDAGAAELFRAPATSGGKKVVGGGCGSGGGDSDEKAAMALKNHSEAERRRRERINSHLATLRSMVPCTKKMDKAALLAEVINHVKVLKRNAVEVSNGYTIPSDIDEVRVEIEGDKSKTGSFMIKASLCCEDRPEVLSDLKQMLESLQLKTVHAEISTLGGRMKNVLVMISEGNSSDIDRDLYMASIQQALKSIVDKINSQMEFMPRTTFSNKRRRITTFESSSSSS